MMRTLLMGTLVVGVASCGDKSEPDDSASTAGTGDESDGSDGGDGTTEDGADGGGSDGTDPDPYLSGSTGGCRGGHPQFSALSGPPGQARVDVALVWTGSEPSWEEAHTLVLSGSNDAGTADFWNIELTSVDGTDDYASGTTTRFVCGDWDQWSAGFFLYASDGTLLDCQTAGPGHDPFIELDCSPSPDGW